MWGAYGQLRRGRRERAIDGCVKPIDEQADAQPIIASEGAHRMEDGTIERAIEIDASPATVYEVITSPEHLTQWWPDEAVIDPTPGAVGELVFGDRSSPTAHIPQITVVEAEPPRLFSFRWVYPDGEDARHGNSLLVTGWDLFLPRLAAYAPTVGAAS
jgi:uncharacterized protein YndB with AHSA1/START domain